MCYLLFLLLATLCATLFLFFSSFCVHPDLHQSNSQAKDDTHRNITLVLPTLVNQPICPLWWTAIQPIASHTANTSKENKEEKTHTHTPTMACPHNRKKWVVLTHFGYLSAYFSTSLENFISRACILPWHLLMFWNLKSKHCWNAKQAVGPHCT